MAEPTTPTELDIYELTWLVWFARKVRGTSRNVAALAWEQNPALRFRDREQEAAAKVRAEFAAAVEALETGLDDRAIEIDPAARRA